MILVDTGAWLALADKGDAYHARCVAFFRSNREPLMTTYPVLVECVHLMFRRIGVAKTLAWMDTLAAQGVGVFAMGADHLPRLTELMRQYADLPMDLADASLVLLAEEFGEGRIVSTDERDFPAYRWKSQHPFSNLLLVQS
jgi:predicted nucleic acid-binding protein